MSNTLTLSSSEFSTNKGATNAAVAGALSGAAATALAGVAAKALKVDADNKANTKGRKRETEITKMPCLICEPV
jgi:hypothetical protein